MTSFLISNIENYLFEHPLFFLFFFNSILIGLAIVIYSSLLGVYGIISLIISSLFFLNYSLLFFFFFCKYTNVTYSIFLCNWFKILGYTVTIDYFVDYFALSFASLTSNIGFFSVIYAVSYFRGEPFTPRLLILIYFFIISMELFVFAGNLIILFLGWELIGLTSFLLINFWTVKIASLKSAFKAYFFNKFSDSFLLIYIVFVFNCLYTLDIQTIISQLGVLSETYFHVSLLFNFKVTDLLIFFLLLGSFIKSSQFMLHIWLPDSMEAPIPASALIHSATLVSAGIYLLIRFNVLLEISPVFSTVGLVWGSLTSLYGGVVSCAQTDLKKILAYSTISHCGNLVVLVCSGCIDSSIVYLFIHGYFKAFSFFSVGNIIRFFNNIQDFRKMGMVAFYLVQDAMMLSVSLVNLGGLPLSIGFYLKHYILDIIDMRSSNGLISGLALVGSSLTGFIYSFRILYYVFFDFKKGNINSYIVREDKKLISKYFSSIPLGMSFLFCFMYINAQVISLAILKIHFNTSVDYECYSYFVYNSNPIHEYNKGIVSYNNINFLSLLLLVLLLDYIYNTHCRVIVTNKSSTELIYPFICFFYILFPFIELLDFYSLFFYIL